jgi:type I restriction enzyme M protein
MAIKKSELYGSLWKSCDELRGGMDASQYKDYVLVLLFIKYVSDKYTGGSDDLIVVPQGAASTTWWPSRAARKSVTRSIRL